MRQQILLDTGPLVALIDRRDHYHPWVKTELATIQPPLLSCEAVCVAPRFQWESFSADPK